MADDAVSLITQDHRELEAMFTRLRTERSARPLLTALVGAMLVAHSRAEEAEVYPALVKAAPQEKGEVHHGTEEHHEAEALFLRLAEADPDSAEYDSALEKFVAAVEHHVEEEESEILPALRESVPDAKRAEMGKAFARRRAQEILAAGTDAPGSGSKGASGPETEASRDELYEKAKKADISGRSTMNKEELAEAVQHAGG